MQSIQAGKAERFRAQHQAGKLFVLANIWDAMGAKLLEISGYESVATASIATAIANGYRDGEKIPFQTLLQVVKKISDAVSIPLTVDIERGFAESIRQLGENIHSLIDHGAVGINIEDSLPGEQGLEDADRQCRKIEIIRETGKQCGVAIVINARTDNFLVKQENALKHSIERAKLYMQAGADCIYPIQINSYEFIEEFRAAVKTPVNVNLSKPVRDLHKLQQLGVSRVSVGPQLLNHVLTYMKQVADGLLNNDSTHFFNRDLLPRNFLDQLV